jgi:predicted MFS family arabinose efflux permease
MSIALIAHLVPGFAPLVGVRFLFGIGFGALWTAGIAWVGELAEPSDRERALARPMTIAGVSWMFAPVLAGLAAQVLGVRVPFVASGVAGLAVCALLLRVPEPVHVVREATPSLGETLRRASQEPVVVASLLFTLVASCASAAIYLLVPLQLHDDGLSAGSIGAAFSVGALVFAAGAWVIARMGGRAMQVVVGGAAVGLLAIVLVLPVISTTVPALVMLLVLRSPLFAVLFGISYPLGGLGADRAGIGRGVVLGLLNGVWALSNVLGPVAGGALADVAGRSSVYVLLAVASAFTAAWAWPQRRLIIATS